MTVLHKLFLVPRKYLFLVSGLMWSGVGIMLISLASEWLIILDSDYPVRIVMLGVFPGVLIAVFGFARIVQRNIYRIETLSIKASVFSFQTFQSYLLIIVMMSMGIIVRHTGLIPLILKTPGYYTIGTALSLSSVRYFQEFFRTRG